MYIWIKDWYEARLRIQGQKVPYDDDYGDADEEN